MGLAERLSEWLLRRRERQEERNMRQVTAYFGSLLKKEACGCRRNPPVRQGLPGLPGGDKETGGAAAGTQVLPVRVPDGLSRMAGGHGRLERDPLRDA